MIRVLSLPLTEDIGPLCAFLRAQGVTLRVVEAGGRQELWIADEGLAAAVRSAYERYHDDALLRRELRERREDRRPAAGNAPDFWWQLRRFPVVATLLGSLLMAGIYTGFGTAATVTEFLIVDYSASPLDPRAFGWTHLLAALQAGQWWRLLAPAWLHWGPIHLVFNSLGLWIFGRSLEAVLRPGGFLGLVLFSALLANLAQFAFGGPNFGGFSGVVYAFIGAHLVGLRLRGDLQVWVPPALIGFALFGLLLGFSGLTEMGGVSFANAAHLAGFLCGLAWMAWFLPRSDTSRWSP